MIFLREKNQTLMWIFSTELPRNLSLKLAYFTILMTALVVFTAYSASMISFVTACIRNVPFHTIEEFIDDSSYNLIMLKGSSDYDMFIVSLSNNGEFSHDMLSLLLACRMITSYMQYNMNDWSMCNKWKNIFPKWTTNKIECIRFNDNAFYKNIIIIFSIRKILHQNIWCPNSCQ